MMKKTFFLIAITLLSTGLFAQKNKIKVADNFMLFDQNKNLVLVEKNFQLPKNLSQLNFLKKRNLKDGAYIYIIQKKGKKSRVGYTYKGSVPLKKEPLIISEKQILANKITFYDLEDESNKEKQISLEEKEAIHLKNISSNSSLKTKLKLFKDGKRIPNDRIVDSVFINSKIGALSFSTNNYDKKTIIFIKTINDKSEDVNLKLKGKNITYYVNNKKQPEGYNINKLSPDSIKSISVKKTSSKGGTIFITTKEKPIKNPIVYINGKRTTKNVKNINPKTIMKITIIKDKKTAFKLGIPYNENGVIYIETKK